MTMSAGHLRVAVAADGPVLLSLWARLFDQNDHQPAEWQAHASEWFDQMVNDTSRARFPVIDVDAEIVATAIGTLELGVPNPHCPRGRVVRLASVITVPKYRGRGHATALVGDVVAWAKQINADRVDLSSTAAGQRIYERAGFVTTSAPRLKLSL